MSINIKDILTLSDKNKYVVVSKAFYENRDYLYLMDINNNTNIKFCYLDNDELVESEDKIINTKLLPLFIKSTNNSLNKKH